MKKKRKTIKELEGFRLVDGFSGVILGGLWVKEDGTEMKFKVASRDGFYVFRPLKENEKCL